MDEEMDEKLMGKMKNYLDFNSFYSTYLKLFGKFGGEWLRPPNPYFYKIIIMFPSYPR